MIGRLLLGTFPLRLRLTQLPHKDLAQTSTLIIFHAILEAGTHANGQEAAIAREGQGSDTARVLGILADAALPNGVPESNDAVTAAAGEGTVDGMEGQSIDGVDDVDTVVALLGLAVALEGVLARL